MQKSKPFVMFVTRSSEMNICRTDINIHLMSIEQLYSRETSQFTVSPGRVPQLSGRASAAMSQNHTGGKLLVHLSLP